VLLAMPRRIAIRPIGSHFGRHLDQLRERLHEFLPQGCALNFVVHFGAGALVGGGEQV
jgi:hypothetical protein